MTIFLDELKYTECIPYEEPPYTGKLYVFMKDGVILYKSTEDFDVEEREGNFHIEHKGV